MTTPLEYIQHKNWQHRIEADEIEVETCPYCGCDGFHFHVNTSTGKNHCLKCDGGSTLWTLKRDQGDIQIIQPGMRKYKVPTVNVDVLCAALKKSEAAVDFLKSRRLADKKTIEHFRIGYDAKINAITFPYFKDGKLVNVKSMLITEKKFIKVVGYASTLYHIDAIDPKRPVVILEDELDTMAAWKLDFDNVVSLPDGVDSTQAVGALEGSTCDLFIIGTDNDPEGERAAERIADLLGRYRCKRLRLPHRDFNDCLINGMEPDDVQQYIDDAEPMGGNEIYDSNDLVELVRKKLLENPEPALKLGWPPFDDTLGGIRPGEVTVLSGDTGTGKTTFVVNQLYQVVRQAVACLFVSAETSPEKIMAKLYSIHSGKFFDTFRNDDLKKLYPDSLFTDQQLVECKKFFRDKPLYAWSGYGELPLWKLRDLITYAAKFHGVRFVMLDHLHFFIAPDQPDRERYQIEQFTRGMARTAIETGVHIVLIVHPNKEIGTTGRVYMNHLKGAASIKQDASNILTLYRDRNKMQTSVECWLQKVRDDAGQEGQIIFEFDPTCQRYTPTLRDRLDEDD